MIDALLLLLALLGHAAIWVALVNRLHATGVPHWMVRIGTLFCFAMLAAIPVGFVCWCFQPGAEALAKWRAGEVVRSAPIGAMLYLLLCWLSVAWIVPIWIVRHVAGRPPARPAVIVFAAYCTAGIARLPRRNRRIIFSFICRATKACD